MGPGSQPVRVQISNSLSAGPNDLTESGNALNKFFMRVKQNELTSLRSDSIQMNFSRATAP